MYGAGMYGVSGSVANADICMCDHLDFYHLFDSFKCVFPGCECSGFVTEYGADEPDEIISEVSFREKTTNVGTASAAGDGQQTSEMDYGEYLYY